MKPKTIAATITPPTVAPATEACRMVLELLELTTTTTVLEGDARREKDVAVLVSDEVKSIGTVESCIVLTEVVTTEGPANVESGEIAVVEAEATYIEMQQPGFGTRTPLVSPMQLGRKLNPIGAVRAKLYNMAHSVGQSSCAM